MISKHYELRDIWDMGGTKPKEFCPLDSCCVLLRTKPVVRRVRARWTRRAIFGYTARLGSSILGEPSDRFPLARSIGVPVVKLTLRERETAQEAVRRFRKLVERSGIKKEIRIREFYEKPSETKRRARLRAQRRSRRERMLGRA